MISSCEDRLPHRPIRAEETVVTNTPRRLIPTASLTTGPFFPAQFIRAEDHDLTRATSGGPPARGQAVALSGRITDVDGAPAVNAIMELWQADADGKFPPQADKNFRHWGRTWTDKTGLYRFLTIKPGQTGANDGSNQPRPPYINVMVLGSGIMRPLVTQMFFPGEALNDEDPQLSLVEKPRRHLLVAKNWNDDAAPRGALALRFDIKLAGPDETPFFED
jgi:protocatechuate 3,4-dioxygenase alpha subunit